MMEIKEATECYGNELSPTETRGESNEGWTASDEQPARNNQLRSQEACLIGGEFNRDFVTRQDKRSEGDPAVASRIVDVRIFVR